MKIVGIVARTGKYFDRSTIYMFDSFRRICFENNVLPFLILPPQIKDYYECSGKEIGHLTKNEENYLMQCVDRCDGLILPGGDRYYEYDLFIYRYAKEKDIPILGICMGMQLMANEENNNKPIAIGNESHYRKKVDYAHEIEINNKSKLYNIIKKEKINVNSYHYYVVGDKTNLHISALSKEKYIEAIEIPNKKFILGVQWHPEIMYDYDDDNKKLMQSFFEALK